MPDQVSLPALFDGAEQAAMRGDYAAAARFLGDAARLQESTLGTDAVELANTLNNLAVAHERSGDLDAAEREYRRAHEIAAASRPADDPLVTTSAQNLREFCEANGRPLEQPAAATMVLPAPAPVPAAPLEADVPTAIVNRRDLAPAPPAAAEPPARPMPRPPAASPRQPIAVAPGPAPAPARRLPVPLLVAIAALVVLAIWFFAGRRADDAAAQPEAAAPDAVPAPPAASATPAPSTTPVPAPVARPAPPPAPRPAAALPPARDAAAAGVTIGEARLCTALSSNYACTPAGDTVAPGRLTFYTRLIASEDTRVVHRWYRGDELRQAVRLDVAARKQGYRTFSRGTVYATGGEWRVELRTLDGRILHTETFRVQ